MQKCTMLFLRIRTPPKMEDSWTMPPESWKSYKFCKF